MSNDKKIVITTRDRVLRAWQNSTELVRDFENYAKETTDDKTAAEMFQKYAVDEGRHAAELLKLTSLSIGDIGSAVGYENALHFSRAFKNVFRSFAYVLSNGFTSDSAFSISPRNRC